MSGRMQRKICLKDILVLHEQGAHEVLEVLESEFERKISGNKLTTPSTLQQEKDEDQEMQEPLDHSAMLNMT